MGLGLGGRMRQEISRDPYALSDWDTENSSRCFVHIANSMVWRSITGEEPPTTPMTALEYGAFGVPWIDHYADGPAVEGSPILGSVKSVVELGKEKGDVPVPDNESVVVGETVKLGAGLKKGQVREGTF